MEILTLTLNPAIDLTIRLDKLMPGQVHRARCQEQHPGGKGLNVASCLADWGLGNAATGFLGRDNDKAFRALCRDKGIRDCFVRVPGLTRTNIKLVDAQGTTDINLPGLAVGQEDMVSLHSNLEHLQADCDLAVLSGTLPPGCSNDAYARLLASFDPACRVILDASGEALRLALAGKRLPYCVKPNRDELAEWAGCGMDDMEAVARAAAALLRLGVALVAVSLGSEGALFLSRQGCLHARSNARILAGTTGAGDAMVAGIAAALAEKGDLERIARLATAFSVCKLGMIGASLPGRDEVESAALLVAVSPFPSP